MGWDQSLPSEDGNYTMLWSTFSLHLLPLSLAAVTPSPAFKVHEHRSRPPPGFVQKGPTPGGTQLTFQIGLASSDLPGLERTLLDVSTPGSANYGKYLTKEQAEAFVKPTDDTVTSVTNWLKSNNIQFTTVSPSGDRLSITIPASKANSLFSTSFSAFTNTKTGGTVHRTLSYSVPSDLSDKIDFVHPTLMFPTPVNISPTPKKLKPLTSSAVDPSCNTTITPQCLQDLYGIPKTPATQSSNRLGVLGYVEEWANTTDLRAFLTQFRPDADPNQSFTVVSVEGGTNDESEPGFEASLDIQYTIGIATNVPTEFITVAGAFDGSFADFAVTVLDSTDAILDMDEPPQVTTTSYGTQAETDVTMAFFNKACYAFAQLGARGVSVLVSSGDGGAGGGHDPDPQGCTGFMADFPGGCPFITTVGATTQINPEIGVEFSSGGFSNYFPRPAYQDGPVQAFLDKFGNTDAGLFNASGRAFPDISAQGVEFTIVVDGFLFGISGTSASSPMTAAVISLLNDRLIAAGRPVLGFLNPWLYANGAQTLNDIVGGNNPGCNTDGFPAIEGWDPVTGMGTPNFPNMLANLGLS